MTGAASAHLPLFLAEAREHLAGLERALLALESRPSDPSALADAFRHAHTFKGMAAAVGMRGLAAQAHEAESLLARARLRPPDRDEVAALLRQRDALADALEQAAASGADPARPRSATVRIETSRLDGLLDAASGLVATKGRLVEALRRAGAGGEEAARRFDRLASEVYEGILEARLLPLSLVYDRFPRMVRELGGDQGKDVELVVEGGEVRADRRLVEALADPLLHLLRNALDHGVEPPRERIAAGKPRVGRIRVRARREPGRLVVEVSDDGRGIDAARVARRAIEAGLLDKARAASVSVEEACAVLARGGVSTAERVTATSGRGVGLDAARAWVEEVGGSLALSSLPGAGTSVRLFLPLEVALLRALVVRAGGARYALPVAQVAVTLDLAGARDGAGGLRAACEAPGGPVPLVSLAKHLGGAGGDETLALVVETPAGRVALGVSEVLGNEEVVIKPLDARFVRDPAFAGAAFLGDGRVALLLAPGAWMMPTAAQADASAAPS